MSDDDEVPLALYTAVIAALGEGYPLAFVLEHEGLSHGTWEAAEERWVDRLEASAEGDLSLFDSLERALASARARFARPVDPLDDDLEQFLAFKSHLAEAEKPIAMLAEHGLFLGDWVRLQERWAEKLGADSALRTKAAMVLRASEAPPLPVVRPGPRALPLPQRPRPVARVVGTTISSDAAEPVEWGLALFRDTPQIHDMQHSATTEHLAPSGAESPVVTSAAESSTPEPHREIHAETQSLGMTGERPVFAHHLRAMAENPLPFRPGAPAVAVPNLPPEAEAAIRAIPEGISGDTTLPIPPLEEIRAATRAPLPFKTDAPSNAQTHRPPPTSVASRVSPANVTLPPPPLDRTAEQPLPFKPPDEPVAALEQERIAKAPPPMQKVGVMPQLNETADLTAFVREIRGRIVGSLPSADVENPNEQPSFPSSPLPNPPLSPAAKPPHTLEITADMSATVHELLRNSAERPLPFSSPAAPFPQEPTTLTASAGSPPETGGPPLGPGLDPDDMPTLQRSYAKDPEAAGHNTNVQPSLTLEQYAQLCIQLSKEPARAVEIRARYGLADDSAWAIVQWRWQDRMDRDPDLHRRWLELTALIREQK
jgi:hypothetical protein